ncbi:TPA: hypothetical protein ACOD97_000214 [Stenotrophomonas maltophilia]
MAIVDNAFREWIADFKAINPDVADARAVIDTAQYAFAAGRKAQREIDAAGQPVSETDAYQQGFRDGQDRTCTVVARPPVGRVSYYSPMNFGGFMIQFTSPTKIEPGTPLYDAPTAQAVDLEQFRPAVCAMGLYAEEPEDVDEAKRLLALIDSQAVGK